MPIARREPRGNNNAEKSRKRENSMPFLRMEQAYYWNTTVYPIRTTAFSSLPRLYCCVYAAKLLLLLLLLFFLLLLHYYIINFPLLLLLLYYYYYDSTHKGTKERRLLDDPRPCSPSIAGCTLTPRLSWNQANLVRDSGFWEGDFCDRG